MKRLCAWCGSELPSTSPDGTERVSHGICIPCVELHFPDIADRVKGLREAA